MVADRSPSTRSVLMNNNIIPDFGLQLGILVTGLCRVTPLYRKQCETESGHGAVIGKCSRE